MFSIMFKQVEWRNCGSQVYLCTIRPIFTTHWIPTVLAFYCKIWRRRSWSPFYAIVSTRVPSKLIWKVHPFLLIPVSLCHIFQYTHSPKPSVGTADPSGTAIECVHLHYFLFTLSVHVEESNKLTCFHLELVPNRISVLGIGFSCFPNKNHAGK